jgi:serine phosphatase RsbU (regulator of sigma subunit)
LPLRGLYFNYGMLYLLKAAPNTFVHEDLSILQTFTSQAVLSIENLELVRTSLENQRTQEELKIASQVQDSLIPKNLPTDNWFEISSHSLAAKEVGGDFYDFLHLPGRRLAVIIGDVSGKGVTAAFHMAQMKGIFHSLMQENPLAKTERDKFPVPSRFMTQANTALAHCLEKSSFITSSLYIIDYEQGGFVFARAGHCHTLYYHALREEVFYFESTGLGLGIIRNESYEKHIKNQFYDYSPGDVMVIYTDGIVEARGEGSSEYGEDRLKLRLEESYYQDAEDIKSFILRDLNAFTHGYPIHDDQTLLVIKFKSAQPLPLA